jgi:hypothetical protein
MRKGRVVENMAVLLVETLIPIIPHLQHPICNAEGIGIIIMELVFGNFNGPSVYIFPVKEVLPCCFVRLPGLGRLTGTEAKKYNGNYRKVSHKQYVFILLD